MGRRVVNDAEVGYRGKRDALVRHHNACNGQIREQPEYMEEVSRIAEAANTIVPAVLALRSLGYRVRASRTDTSPDETWHAEGPLGEFIADGPVALLGLIAMREERGADWKASDDEIDAFMIEYGAE